MTRKKNYVISPIRRNRPERTGIGAPLGDLEIAVMRHIWACGPQGCQGTEVQNALNPEHPVALTTVLTTLERLLAKGILLRVREGKAYRYWAALSEEQLQQRIVDGVMDRLIAQFPRAVAAYFAQQGTAGDKAGNDLNDLARRVEAAAQNPIAQTDTSPGAEQNWEETNGH